MPDGFSRPRTSSELFHLVVVRVQHETPSRDPGHLRRVHRGRPVGQTQSVIRLKHGRQNEYIIENVN